MAETMHKNSIHVQESISNIQEAAWNAAESVMAIGTGEIKGKKITAKGGGSSKSKKITVSMTYWAVSWVILPSPSPSCLMIFSCASAYSFFAVSSALSASSLVICPLIGNTWNDTADVIEGVTTQFENLAKVQEAVADGLTMSATAAGCSLY